MKRRNNKFKWAALCAALLFSAAVGMPTAHAAEPQGSITVHYHGCSDMEVPIDLPGAEFVLYPVGERQGDCWVLTGAFADAEVSLKNDAASERARSGQSRRSGFISTPGNRASPEPPKPPMTGVRWCSGSWTTDCT